MINPTNKIEKLWVRNSTLFIEGLAYIQGYNSPAFSDLYKSLRLKNIQTKAKLEYGLGSLRRPELKSQTYKGRTYDYTASGTATKGLKGIDISQLETGIYEIGLSVSTNESDKQYSDLILAFHDLDKRSADNWFEYRLYQKDRKTYLVKRSIIGRRVDDYSYIHIEKDWINGRTFHLEGEFIIPGADLTDFTQGKYYLIIKKTVTQRQYAFELGQIKQTGLGDKINNPFGDYNTCYFATLKLEGINTTGFELGEYELYVSLGYKSELFTGKLNKQLKITTSDSCELI